MPGTVGPEDHESTSLRGIAKRARVRKDHCFQNLYRCLNVELLQSCWCDLNKKAAGGVDGVTAEAYEKNLDANIRDLVERLKTKRYRAKLIRRCYIDKENGGQRPLGIPAPGRQAGAARLRQTPGSHLRAGLSARQLWLPTGREVPRAAVQDLGFNTPVRQVRVTS